MISISASALAYRIGTRDILTDVTFALEDGDKLGIVGVNGSGKSTLPNPKPSGFSIRTMPFLC